MSPSSRRVNVTGAGRPRAPVTRLAERIYPAGKERERGVTATEKGAVTPAEAARRRRRLAAPGWDGRELASGHARRGESRSDERPELPGTSRRLGARDQGGSGHAPERCERQLAAGGWEGSEGRPGGEREALDRRVRARLARAGWLRSRGGSLL